jgi:hypothetical protein
MLIPGLHSSACPSGQHQQESADPAEELIGDLVAATACVLARGVGECWARGKKNGRMSADTREQGATLIAGLVELRNGTAGELDFNAVARSQGRRVLAERYGQGISDRTIDNLIDATLDVLRRIIRARLH